MLGPARAMLRRALHQSHGPHVRRVLSSYARTGFPAPGAPCAAIRARPQRAAEHLRHCAALLSTRPDLQRAPDGDGAEKPGLARLVQSARRMSRRLAHSPYGRLMRLDKPVGSYLLFLPAVWGVSMGATSASDLVGLSALVCVGAPLLRSAGCTINDIWDADIDKRVVRTQGRPIASGEISVPAAVTFLGAQLTAGLCLLSQLNVTAFIVGTASIMPILFYPLAKRHFAYPQAVLGLTFNMGALLGYAAAADALALPAFLLYGAGWCWTMVYDTIYAHQDKVDDSEIGVNSTALGFGKNNKLVLGAFAAGKFAFLIGAGVAADLSMPYYAGVTVASLRLAQQIYSTDLNDPQACNTAFTSSPAIGVITWLSILAGRVV